MAKIGVFGGTFNPPHVGHIQAADAVRAALELDQILFIPDGSPPHKTMPDGSPDAQTRLAQSQEAVRE